MSRAKWVFLPVRGVEDDVTLLLGGAAKGMPPPNTPLRRVILIPSSIGGPPAAIAEFVTGESIPMLVIDAPEVLSGEVEPYHFIETLMLLRSLRPITE